MSTATALAKPAYAYDATTGLITRTPPGGVSEIVGHLKDGALNYVTTHPKIREIIRRMLTDHGVSFSDGSTTPSPQANSVPERDDSVPATDWRTGLKPEVVRAIMRLRREQGFPDVTVEPTPGRRKRSKVMLEKLGDKNPEVVLWRLRYNPAKFHEAYTVLGEGEHEYFEKIKDPESEAILKVKRRLDTVIAKRQVAVLDRRGKLVTICHKPQPHTTADGDNDEGVLE